jgi:hypothetical protein
MTGVGIRAASGACSPTIAPPRRACRTTRGDALRRAAGTRYGPLTSPELGVKARTADSLQQPKAQ